MDWYVFRFTSDSDSDIFTLLTLTSQFLQLHSVSHVLLLLALVYNFNLWMVTLLIDALTQHNSVVVRIFQQFLLLLVLCS